MEQSSREWIRQFSLPLLAFIAGITCGASLLLGFFVLGPLTTSQFGGKLTAEANAKFAITRPLPTRSVSVWPVTQPSIFWNGQSIPDSRATIGTTAQLIDALGGNEDFQKRSQSLRSNIKRTYRVPARTRGQHQIAPLGTQDHWYTITILAAGFVLTGSAIAIWSSFSSHQQVSPAGPETRSRLAVPVMSMDYELTQSEGQRGAASSGASSDKSSSLDGMPSRDAPSSQTLVESERIKSELYKMGLMSGRGAWARESERARAASLVEELERSAIGSSRFLRDGVWELVMSDIEPFRASTFFLALAHAVEANIMSGASDGALTVHSRATGGGEVGRVAHIIEGGGSRLRSLVELRSGSLPSLPLALTGTVISTGALTADEIQSDATASPTFSLTLESTSVQESKVQYGFPRDGSLRPNEDSSLLSWIGDQVVPAGNIFDQILDPIGGGQVATLELSYADDDLIVWRMPKLSNHYFVMVRGEEATWPSMDELRQREENARSSPVGSAFALGMLNPFFSRRMRQ